VAVCGIISPSRYIKQEIIMTQLTLEMPETAFASLHKNQAEFTRELRVAAAVKWYELELLSQGRAAEIAGLTRADFITALGQYKVSPFQYTAEEVLEDLANAN
jgi:predicted HTH domain antitoxin